MRSHLRDAHVIIFVAPEVPCFDWISSPLGTNFVANILRA